MSSGITTTIRMKPYIKEFVLSRFLQNEYKATADDPLGVIIKPFLVSPPKNLIRVEAEDNDEYFTFELPNYSDKKVMVYNYVSKQGQMITEYVFELVCRNSMFIHIDQNIELNGGFIKDWIMNWCTSNGVSFCKVNYETLKKAYYRYRENKEETEQKICTRLLPLLPPKFHFIVPQLSDSKKDKNILLEEII